MRSMIPLAVLLMAFAVPAEAVAQYRAAPWGPAYGPPVRGPVPNISGTWFRNGEEENPTEIQQQGPDGREARFINENGDEAWGEVRPDSVWIPEWKVRGHRGLMGQIRGDRIVWPDGSFWSRRPVGGDYGPRWRDDYGPRRRGDYGPPWRDDYGPR